MPLNRLHLGPVHLPATTLRVIFHRLRQFSRWHYCIRIISCNRSLGHTFEQSRGRFLYKHYSSVAFYSLCSFHSIHPHTCQNNTYCPVACIGSQRLKENVYRIVYYLFGLTRNKP